MLRQQSDVHLQISKTSEANPSYRFTFSILIIACNFD